MRRSAGLFGGTGYNVKRSTTSGGPYGALATDVTTTGDTDSALTNGIAHHFVSATNSRGESPNPATGTSSTLAVGASSAAGAGTYTVTVTGTSGSIQRAAPATLVVSSGNCSGQCNN